MLKDANPVKTIETRTTQSQGAAMPPAAITGWPMPQIQKPFSLPPQDRVAYAVVGFGR